MASSTQTIGNAVVEAKNWSIRIKDAVAQVNTLGDAIVLLVYITVALELFRMIWSRLRWLVKGVLLPVLKGCRDIWIALSAVPTKIRQMRARNGYCSECRRPLPHNKLCSSLPTREEYLRDHSKRLSFLTGKAQVYGWPSTGGVLIKEVSAVEIDWLDLSRFAESQRSEDGEDEDAFCARFRRLGARWYRYQGDYINRHMMGRGRLSRAAIEPRSRRLGTWVRSVDLLPDIDVGFPSRTSLCSANPGPHGTWILRLSLDELEAMQQRCRLNLAVTMDERRFFIEELGGQCFEDAAEECPGLVSAPVEHEELELEKLQAEGLGKCERYRQAYDVDDSKEEDLHRLQLEMAM